MLHDPWGHDESKFPQDGVAIVRWVRAFTDHGGDTDVLCDLLNRHVADARWTVNPEDLVRPDRRYSYEFYLYLYVFAKILLNDPSFRFTQRDGGRLESFHTILEQGPLRFDPWQCDDCGAMMGYLSITNMSSMFLYAEEELGTATIARDALDCLNGCVPEEFRVTRGFFDKEEILISMEYLIYLSVIFMMLTNDSDFVYKSLYYGFLHNITLARSIFLQPTLSPVECFMHWQTRTNNLYRMEFRQRPRQLDVRLHLQSLLSTGMLGDYREAGLDGIRKACLGVYRAFLELATQKPVRTRIVANDRDHAGFTVRIHWRSPVSTPKILFLSVVGTSAYVAATILAFHQPGPIWPRILISGITGASLAGLVIALLISRKRAHTTKRQFADTRTVINEQYLSLRKTSEELLQERNALEEKVRLRTAELENALERLTELDRAKTNFLATITHELRTPLTLLSVPLENIRAERYGSTIPADHRIFEMVERNLGRLNDQITQLLDFARLDLGTMPFRPEVVPLVAYARGLVAELESLAERKGLQMLLVNRATTHEVWIRADKTLLETALLNLLNNALKFTERGEVRLVVGPEVGDETVRLAVEDTGIGFDMDIKDTLFERFTRSEEAHTRSFEGAGLGLAIVREVAALHGWRLDAEGRPGAGATFYLDIPVSVEQVASAGDVPAPSAELTRRATIAVPITSQVTNGPEAFDRRTILLVDDNPDMGTLVRDVLEPEYNVVWCRDGSEALACLSEHTSIDLVLCDVMMPGMSGFTLREHLSEQSDTQTIPFVFLTALNDVEDRFRGLAGGAVDYILKPFAATELRLKIRNILEIQDARYRQALSDSVAVERLSRIGVSDTTDAPDAANAPDTTRILRERSVTAAERRVLELLRQGLQDKEIADRLSISPRTVASHLHRLYRKTETGNRLELMAWMVDVGLTS